MAYTVTNLPREWGLLISNNIIIHDQHNELTMDQNFDIFYLWAYISNDRAVTQQQKEKHQSWDQGVFAVHGHLSWW